jgi:hypothetical protein
VIADRPAFLLPLDLALQYVPNLHLSMAHSCPKKGIPSGLPLGDLSNVDGTRINTDETAKAASDNYRTIRHPTIGEIAKMIHDFWMEARRRDPRLRQQDLRLWKMDLKGAYNCGTHKSLTAYRTLNRITEPGIIRTQVLIYLVLPTWHNSHARSRLRYNIVSALSISYNSFVLSHSNRITTPKQPQLRTALSGLSHVLRFQSRPPTQQPPQ